MSLSPTGLPRGYEFDSYTPEKADELLPSEAKVVVVGCGIAGASVAYHLARTSIDPKDVLVLEKIRIGGGTTWHAAGLVGRMRTSSSMTCINNVSASLSLSSSILVVAVVVVAVVDERIDEAY